MWFLIMAAMAQPIPDLQWSVINDTVMGGRSSGEQLRSESGLLSFEGTLSLENNGGFVSVRTQSTELGLEGAQSLLVRLRGDGRTWNLNAYRWDVPMRAGSYRVSIPTVADEVVAVTVPLSDFEPVSFGRAVAGAPALDSHPDRIDRLGFLLGDKQPGSFSLEVISIEVVGGNRTPADDGEVVTSTLVMAVQAGVPAYNRGDVSRCESVYRDALEDVVALDALTDGEKRTVRAALTTSSEQRAGEAAWTLRNAIDTLMAGAR
ncbi:MAG: hypothetical protein GWP91_07720 [Rhodobacterales bacterium]|nr:hypothetical protein [Rhodobacterales bacterium]